MSALTDRFYPLVDRRCNHMRCDEPNAYQMVGHCTNCGYGPLLVLLSARHEVSHEGQCPKCGNRSVHCDRLATDDEMPEPSRPATAASPVGPRDAGGAQDQQAAERTVQHGRTPGEQ